MPTDAIVFDAREPYLASRTLRALARHGVRGEVTNDLAARVRDARGPVWLVRAGAWPFAPPSPLLRGGSPSVVALGATAESAHWREVLASTGGDLRGTALPRVDSAVALDPASFSSLVAEKGSLERAVGASRRVVRVPSIDVGYQEALRIVLVVTTLHRGGAERIVLGLKRELEAAGHDVLLVVLDRAARTTFPAPAGTIALGQYPRAERIDRIIAESARWGADVVHAHLLDGDELERLERGDVPVVVTMHNAQPGWPARIERSNPALTIACSRGVLADLDAASMGGRARTIWNGIQPIARAARPERANILAIANHRPQKRLERLPAVLAEVRKTIPHARLTIFGEPVRAEASGVTESIRSEADRHGVEVTLAPSTEDVTAAYAAADVVVSASDFEGLSLVHLEALSAGVPLVTTPVAGTEELAAKHTHVRIAEPAALGRAIVDVLGTKPSGDLAPDFTTRRMADRHLELYRRAAIAARPRRGGLVLVTNNFSTGGAQSSARRLLTELARADVPVQAIVIEEQASYPTAGRRALASAGIPVHVAPRAGSVDPLVTARAVVRAVDEAAPDALLFWNVIPEHKILIADLCFGLPVWDVSPGEMYFASFARYFARPRIGLPYLDLADYGRLLAGVVVKYHEEAPRARQLGTRVEVVSNGVVVPDHPVRRPRGERFVIGTMARIAPDKKLEQLLDAPLPEGAVLRIAGAPEHGFEAYAAELRARGNAEWVGERGLDFLQEIDLFAMISEPSGCPNASLEAMAAGLPVVATNVGGAADQITPDVGILVSRGDSLALGEAIAGLAGDEARRTALGDSAHARARARYDVRRMATDYARLCLAPR